MSELARYTKLKEKVERIKQESAVAEGALNEVMKRIKKKFGCTSLNEAKKLLNKLKKKEQTSKEAFEEAMDEFEEKWSDEFD